VGAGDRVPGDELVCIGDQVLDRDVKIGVGPKENRPHLLERLRARPVNRQWRADAHVLVDHLVDRFRDELHIAAVDGVVKAGERRFVAGYLGC